MTSDAEASPRATCRATTKAGAPCRKQAVDDGLCMFHSGKLDLAELGRRGGQARGRKKEEQASDRLEGLAHVALEELLSSGSSTARVAAAKYALDRLTANGPAGLEVAKRALWLDQQVQMQAELPFARERLARLSESRATEKAKEMHKEQRRLEVEAVRAELEVAPEETPETPTPEVDEPAPSAPSAADLQQQIADELARSEAERLRRELGLEQDDLRGMS
jgi:hypothetical protein